MPYYTGTWVFRDETHPNNGTSGPARVEAVNDAEARQRICRRGINLLFDGDAAKMSCFAAQNVKKESAW